MRITVFGASGKVGRQVVEQLLTGEHDVVAFVHSAAPFAVNSRLTVQRGDVHEAADVARAIEGSQAVICALGSWGTSSKDIVSSAVTNLVPAMEAANIRRIITLTGADARAEGDNLHTLHRLTHWFIGFTPAQRILEDGERHIKLLEASALDWTVVRSPVMRTFGGRRYKLSNTRPLPWASVHRMAVARCLVERLDRKEFVRQAPFIAAA